MAMHQPPLRKLHLPPPHRQSPHPRFPHLPHRRRRHHITIRYRSPARGERMDANPPVPHLLSHRHPQPTRHRPHLRPNIHRRHLHPSRMPPRRRQPRPRHRLALDAHRINTGLHTTIKQHRPTPMRGPRRRARSLKRDQRLLARNTNPALPRPHPTRCPPLHHHAAPHRCRAHPLPVRADTHQRPHLRASSTMDRSPA